MYESIHSLPSYCYIANDTGLFNFNKATGQAEGKLLNQTC